MKPLSIADYLDHLGRALFDVAHDAGRPFVVEAGARQVTALGTRFDVRLATPLGGHGSGCHPQVELAHARCPGQAKGHFCIH